MKENYSIIGLDGLSDEEIDFLIRESIKIDYEAIDGLVDIDEGTLEQWKTILSKSSNTEKFILRNNEVIGYWHFLSLTEEAFLKAERGKLIESELTPEDVVEMNEPGIYNIYIVGVCLKERYHKTKAFYRIVQSFIETLKEFNRKGMIIKYVLTNAYTDVSKLICKKLGFKFLTSHINSGDMYIKKF